MRAKLLSLAVSAAAVLGCGGTDNRSAWFAGSWDDVSSFVAPAPLMLSDMTAAVDGCSTLTLSGNLTRPAGQR